MPPTLMPVTGPLPIPMSPPGAGGPGLGGGRGAALFASPLGSPAGLLPVHIAGPPLRPQSFSPVTNLRDNPPCNTLFM
jgi:hypothetical protein